MNTTTLPPLTTAAVSSAKAPRIATVDALRGFALFGILLVHCAQWFAAGPLPGSVYQTQASGPGNMVAQIIVGIFFDGKFYTLFSFLFGLSFALMLTRTTNSPGTFYRRFAWRLVVLGLIGFLHHLQWRGDILSIYAMLGFLMIPFARLSNKVVLIVALLLVANAPNRIRSLYETFISQPAPMQPQQAQQNFEKDAQTFYDTLKKGSYAAIVESNLYAFDDKMRFQVDSGRLYITLGFFLLGLYAGRRRLFQHIDEHKPLFRRLTRICGFGVLGIIALFGVAILIVGPNGQPPKPLELLFNFLFDMGNTALTIFYITGLTMLFQRRSWQGTVRLLTPVGKMGLTSYVLQTLIGTFVFFGYGLGLLAEIPMWQAALLTVPIFFAQVLLARLWLSQFRYGPLEWLWRSLTYLKTQPMRT